MNESVPETSIEVPLIFVGGRWRVDPRAFGEPLYPVCDPYIDGAPVPGGDTALAAAREVLFPDGAELGQLLRDAGRSFG